MHTLSTRKKKRDAGASRFSFVPPLGIEPGPSEPESEILSFKLRRRKGLQIYKFPKIPQIVFSFIRPEALWGFVQPNAPTQVFLYKPIDRRCSRECRRCRSAGTEVKEKHAEQDEDEVEGFRAEVFLAEDQGAKEEADDNACPSHHAYD